MIYDILDFYINPYKFVDVSTPVFYSVANSFLINRHLR